MLTFTDDKIELAKGLVQIDQVHRFQSHVGLIDGGGGLPRLVDLAGRQVDADKFTVRQARRSDPNAR